MARTGTLDPLSTYRFIVHVKIDNEQVEFERLGFESITLPRIDIQKQQYRELGRHLSPRNLVEGATYSPITMRRGKTYGQDFYNWMGLVYRAFYGDETGSTSNYRGTIVVDHVDRSGNVIKKYVLLNASPITYMPGSQLAAMEDTSVSIETLMLDYEGYIELSISYDAITAAAGALASEVIGGILGSSKITKLDPGFTPEVKSIVENVNARKAAKSY